MIARWESYAALDGATFASRIAPLDARLQREAMRLRFRGNLPAFLKFCFPALFDAPWNRFHLDVLTRPKAPWAERIGRTAEGSDTDTDTDSGLTLRAVAAPRGIAKTTLLKGELVHDLVYGLENYIVVVSSETRLARGITKHLRRLFLARGSRLDALYGPFIVEGGVDEFSVVFPDGRRVGVLARSFGTQVRGANEDGARPTKIVIDDGERPGRVRNPRLRREDQEFLDDDILKAGPIEGGLNVDWRGTVLATDSILANLLTSPGWEGSKWQAVEKMPDRLDLWEECGRVFKDLALGKVAARRRAAQAFYNARRAEMDAGAVVLDPFRFGLFQFFCEVWIFGWRSVLRERQNDPHGGGTKFFRVYPSSPAARDGFARCRVEGDKATGGYLYPADGRPRIPLSEVRFFARLDPIPGKELGTMGDDNGAGAGDFAAIAIVGKDAHGYSYVVDVWLRRARDSEQVSALWDLCEKWRVEKVSVESNGFQRFVGRDFRQQQEARRKAGRWVGVSVEVDKDARSSTNKEDRIAALESPTTNRWLQFAEHLPPELWRQFDLFPGCDHDDGPDAVEGAWRLSGAAVQVGMVEQFRRG